MSAQTIPAAVLAAGHDSEPVAEAAGVAHKALVEIGGQPVVARVVDGLRQARLVDDLVVVTAPGSPVVEALPSDTPSVATKNGSFMDTIQGGFDYHAARDQLLVVMCDLPLLTGEAVDHFVAAALDTGAELCYSMHRAEDLDKIHASRDRVTVRLKDGDYCGGNVHLIGRHFFERETERISQAFAGRKNPLALASLLGVSFIVRFLLRRLTVADIVQRARELLHCKVAAICSPYAEVGFDLDKPEHIAAAEAMVDC